MRHAHRTGSYPFGSALGLMLTLLLGASAALAATAPALAAPDLDRASDIDRLLAARMDNPRLGPKVALLAVDAATGQVLSDHGADDLMLPASNMKIITALNALAALGPQTRFSTRVRQGPTPADIVLEGGGDPLLASADLRALARSTARALPVGVPVVVHVDDDLFVPDGLAPGWPRGYIPSEASPVQALARLGDYSADPSAHAASAFVAALNRRGIPATLGPDADAGESTVIAQSEGHSVADAIRVMLRISENNVAEVLFRQVALAVGKQPTWEGSRSAAEQVLRDLALDPTGMALLDGSGLSRDNRVTPRFLVAALRLARVVDPARFSVMFDDAALPTAGGSGYLGSRYGRFVTRHSRCARDDVQAKTGSLFDTIGLSGIATTEASGERVFSILVNDRPTRYSALATRQAVDGLAATITGCWS